MPKISKKKGVGRPRELRKDSRFVGFMASPAMIRAIDAARGKRTRSAYLRDLIEDKFPAKKASSLPV